MTVKKLREELSNLPDDIIVVNAFDGRPIRGALYFKSEGNVVISSSIESAVFD